MIKFTLQKCKTKAAYSARPIREQTRLNLQKIKKIFPPFLDTPILLVLKVQGIEIIVHTHGQILFKKCSDEELMQKIATKIYQTQK